MSSGQSRTLPPPYVLRSRSSARSSGAQSAAHSQPDFGLTRTSPLTRTGVARVTDIPPTSLHFNPNEVCGAMPKPRAGGRLVGAGRCPAAGRHFRSGGVGP